MGSNNKNQTFKIRRFKIPNRAEQNRILLVRYRCLVLKSSDIALFHPSNQVFIASLPQLSLPGYMLSDRLSIKRWTGAYYQTEHYSDWSKVFDT